MLLKLQPWADLLEEAVDFQLVRAFFGRPRYIWGFIKGDIFILLSATVADLKTQITSAFAKTDGLVPTKCDSRFYIGLTVIELLLAPALGLSSCSQRPLRCSDLI
jgi:hypothetical protein